MSYGLGASSIARLVGVHPSLVRVVHGAILRTTVDFLVLEGVRSDEQAFKNYGKGRTVAELAAKGVAPRFAMPHENKVTWLNDPLATKHRQQKDGYGHAVDLLPYPVDWNTISKFDAISRAMFASADVENVPIRWGYDWDRDGRPREKGESDGPHFELV